MSRNTTGTKIQQMQAVGHELLLLGTEIDALDARAAERFGLNRSDLRCLDVLSHSGPMSPTALAHAVGMSTGGLSISLGRLERAGYVRRTMDPKDRRRVSVELTRKAQRIEQEIFGALLNEVGELLQDYSVAELTVIREFLQRVRGAVAAAGRPKGDTK
ncbi:MAG TPA: MarR family transcriptional regulator [Solirubrobacteraceae bacterium]|nr:MarR family transcriptional regulator [Solirubrobacteraceae bacterium]